MKNNISSFSGTIGTPYEKFYISLLYSFRTAINDLNKYLKDCTLHGRKVKEIKISKVYFKENK